MQNLFRSNTCQNGASPNARCLERLELRTVAVRKPAMARKAVSNDADMVSSSVKIFTLHWKSESWNMSVVQPQTKERRKTSIDHPTAMSKPFGVYCRLSGCSNGGCSVWLQGLTSQPSLIRRALSSECSYCLSNRM